MHLRWSQATFTAPGYASCVLKELQPNAPVEFSMPHLLLVDDDPEAIVGWGHALGAANVVLKLGAEGALVSDGTRLERIAGIAVQVVDATGAGDCFCGNFLARVAAGDTVFEAARYANAAAALAVQGFGAVAPLPRPELVRELL